MKAEDVIIQVIEICRKHNAEEVFLFGSRAKGTERERSDIDIAVAGVQDFGLLEEEVDFLPTLYTVDLVNLDLCENRLLMEDIKQYGRKIYEKI